MYPPQQALLCHVNENQCRRITDPAASYPDDLCHDYAAKTPEYRRH